MRDEIIRAYDDLRTARTEMHDVSEAELAAREALKVRELQNNRQRAALKILGQRAGKRGKALVEAKAKICRNALPFPDNCMQSTRRDWEDCPNKDKWRQIARQQLRREELL